MTNLFIGARYLFTGLGLIKQAGLRRYVAIPMLINIVIFSLLVWLGFGQFEVLMEWLLPKGDSWWVGAASAVLWTVFAFVVMLVFYFLFTLVANIIASPFNGLLAEKVQLKLGQALPQTHGWSSAFTGFPRAMVSEGRKLLYFLLIFFLLLVLTIIPVVNLLSPILWPLFAGWMLTLEYIAYPMEVSGHLFPTVRRKARENRMMALGFGLTALLLTIIPLINFLVIPAAVAGASAMWVERWSKS
ncbi:MAG: sulfate transporter CysZ [Proteobacteria bacterium]|nr:sulfate transporter CysZ [Pseudomonadota bacterium]